MNRGEMRTLLRERLGDEDVISYSNTSLNRQLNYSAQSLAFSLAQHDWSSPTRRTLTLSAADINETDRTIGLDADDIYDVLDVQGGPYDAGCKFIDEREFKKKLQEVPRATGRATDDGRTYVSLVQGKLGAFDAAFDAGFDIGYEYALKFLVSPASGEQYVVVYAAKLVEIGDGANYDTMAYHQVKSRYHHMLVDHAATALTMQDNGSASPLLLELFRRDEAEMVRDTRNRPEPLRTGAA